MWIRLVLMLGGLLLNLSKGMVGRVLLALGLSFVTYSGFNFAVNWLLDQIKSNIAGLPTQVVSFLAYMWVDKAIGMVFSAYTAAIAIKAAGATSITKLVRKG